jgi:hypothetical protein
VTQQARGKIYMDWNRRTAERQRVQERREDYRAIKAIQGEVAAIGGWNGLRRALLLWSAVRSYRRCRAAYGMAPAASLDRVMGNLSNGGPRWRI